MRTPSIVGITGGIACGKSYVGARLSSLADARGLVVQCVDADIVRRDLWRSHGGLRETVRNRVGDEVLDSGGAIDLARLSHRVWSDEQLRFEIEALLQPVLVATLEKALRVPADVVLFESALMVEKQHAALVDFAFIHVTCEPAIRDLRLAGGDLEEVQVRRRIACQLDATARLGALLSCPLPLFSIDTTTTPSSAAVEQLFDDLLEVRRAHRCA